MKLQTTKLLRSLVFLSIAASLPSGLCAAEENAWPFWVGQTAGETVEPIMSWSAVGPFFFSAQYPSPEAPHQIAGGFRPLFVRTSDATVGKYDSYFLYPLFTYHSNPYGHRWSFFSLINHYSTQAPAAPANIATETKQPKGFDLWPFYFSRQTGDPATSYKAVFPIYGTMYKRLGMDRWDWVLFPFYAKAEKRNVTTTMAPWPFIKITKGEGNHGFSFWPLFGWRAKEGAYREQFYLWPLIYKDEHALWQAKPNLNFGVLPFYARLSTPAVESRSYLWPFFGYADRVSPIHYHETRYFWPFLVQGRGDNIYVNRWGPFYTHSIRKGIDKTWVLWPLWRHQEWTDSGLRQTRNQFLWFVWHSTVQHSAKNPDLPAARKTHLWPLVSVWNNGAGQKQVQALSPFAALFPYNEPIQLTYDPLFALYRYDQKSPVDRKHTLLWNFISWRRSPSQKEFHLGPLVSVDSGSELNRVALGCGVIGWRKDAAQDRWHAFFFEFKRRPTKAAPSPL
ncbi:MAG: hypothetical protein QM790_17215 [Nibricoccus sp.]